VLFEPHHFLEVVVEEAGLYLPSHLVVEEEEVVEVEEAGLYLPSHLVVEEEVEDSFLVEAEAEAEDSFLVVVEEDS
jgi:hypothetical protein